MALGALGSGICSRPVPGDPGSSVLSRPGEAAVPGEAPSSGDPDRVWDLGLEMVGGWDCTLMTKAGFQTLGRECFWLCGSRNISEAGHPPHSQGCCNRSAIAKGPWIRQNAHPSRAPAASSLAAQCSPALPRRTLTPRASATSTRVRPLWSAASTQLLRVERPSAQTRGGSGGEEGWGLGAQAHVPKSP